MRIILLLVCLCFLLSPAYGQSSLIASIEKAKAKPFKLESRSIWRPYGPMTATSSAVCFGGMTADLATSIGRNEGNPLFRKADGGINTRRAAVVGFGVCSGTLVVEKLWPKFAKAMSVVRLIFGGGHLVAAIHNSRIPK